MNGSRAGRCLLALVLVILVAASGCSGDGPAAAGGADATTTTVGGSEQRRLALEATVLAAGFEVAVTGIRLVSGSAGRTVAVVDTEVTNRSSEPGSLVTVPATLRHPDLPPVRLFRPDFPPMAPGATAPIELPFLLPDAELDIAAATLVLGDNGQNQVHVPLNGGPPTALSPRPVELAGEVVAGHVRVIVVQAELRYDDPLTHEMLPADQALLVVRFHARRAADGSPNLTSENLRLQLPDGTTIATRNDGRSSPNVVLDKGATVENLLARFAIPAGEAGTYGLVVVGPYGDLGGDARGALPFNLDPSPR